MIKRIFSQKRYKILHCILNVYIFLFFHVMLSRFMIIGFFSVEIFINIVRNTRVHASDVEGRTRAFLFESKAKEG